MVDNEHNRKTLAYNIKRFMELNHVNSVDVCDAIHVPKSTFSYWINALAYPRIEKIEKLANYFGVSIGDLIEDKFINGYNMNLCEDEVDLIYNYREASDEIRGAAYKMLSNSADINRKKRMA